MLNNWRFKLMLLLPAAVPAFSGFPVNRCVLQIPEGVTSVWLLYGALVYLLIGVLMGRHFLATVIAVASLIALPVIFSGALISTCLTLLGPVAYLTPNDSSHYVSLTLTMLTVIPLALAFVAVIPFQKLEHTLMKKQAAIRPWRKSVLMFMRVFNHTIYAVLPTLLEILREEGYLRRSRFYATAIPIPWFKRVGALLRLMKHLGLEAICASVQYIPMWALEISRLPEKAPKTNKPSNLNEA